MLVIEVMKYLITAPHVSQNILFEFSQVYRILVLNNLLNDLTTFYLA